MRAVDVKPLDEWYQVFGEAENRVLDLSERDACREAVAGAQHVFNLAADMGGMGFIEANKALCMLSVLINTHLLLGRARAGVERYFFASSACVYAADKQTSTDVLPLSEADAYPAMPEDGYGWEKLFSERMCRHFTEDFGLATRVARYHNVYGPARDVRRWAGEGAGGDLPQGHRGEALGRPRDRDLGRRRADAQLHVRRRLRLRHEDCSWRATSPSRSTSAAPSSSRSTSSSRSSRRSPGVELERRYKLDAPQGVRGRNSDNTLIQERLGWEPSITLEDGLEKTYAWIYDQMSAGAGARARRCRPAPGCSAPLG